MKETDTSTTYLSFCSLLPESVNDSLCVDKKSSREYVLWGADNKLPYFLWDIYLQCSDLQSLVNTTVDYVKGGDIKTDYKYFSDSDDNVVDVIQKCIFDFVFFGGFALEGIRNSKGEIVRLNYINVQNVRVDEDLTTAYLSNSWGSWSGKNIVELPLFDKGETQSHFIFYYRGSITRNINPIPFWFSALKSAQVLNETRLYNLRNIQNNFSANVMISITGSTLKQRELEEIKEGLRAGYEGSSNAGKTLLINNANSDGEIKVERLDSDKAADIYKNVQTSSQEDLYSAFRINKVLIGQNIQTGFSKVEYQNIYGIYKATVIEPLRNQIVTCFKKLGVNITFSDIQIDWAE